MFRLDGVIHRSCNWIYRLAYLNLLFIISCLPIITVFPATAALFGVVRQWVKKNDPPVFTTFKKLFFENFKQSMILGIGFTSLMTLFIADFYLLNKILGTKEILFISSVVIGFFLILSMLYISPLMVNGYYSTKQLVRTSFQIAIYKPLLTIINLLTLAGLIYFSLRFSTFILFFFFSVSAFITYWISERKFSALQ